MKQAFRRILIAAGIAVGIAVLFVIFVNIYITASTKSKIVSRDAAAELGADAILVLGAGLNGDRPSLMLADRLESAIELYFSGAAPKLIMSGDHGREEYDEVNVMKDYAITAGVPSEDIFMDHAGFSTYDSLYRAREIFGAESLVIVTQEYHLYRALYVARTVGVEAYGAAAENVRYSGQLMRDVRELAARTKDFVFCIFKPQPTYLGEPVALTGSGDITNDKLG